MAKSLGVTVNELIGSKDLIQELDPENFVSSEAGLPTVRDIITELGKPGRDPRSDFKQFNFADVHEPSDLETGMVLPGIVTNVTGFGAFVDVGVHQDGLVHISEMSDSFVKDPSDLVSAGDRIKVRVLSVDLERKRISLSMKEIV